MRKTFLFIVISIPLIIYGIWFVFPENVLKSYIADSLSGNNFSTEITGFKKGLFYDFKIDKLVFENNLKEIMTIEDIDSRINFFRLILLCLDMSVKGKAVKGNVYGRILIKKDFISGNLILNNGRLEEIKALKFLNIDATGNIRAKVEFDSNNMSIEFSSDDLETKPLILKDLYLPLNLFKGFNGSIIKKGDVIEIVSFYLEGKDINARIKGRVDGSGDDCVMEIMLKKGYVEDNLILHELERYKVMPGYYVIPIRH